MGWTDLKKMSNSKELKKQLKTPIRFFITSLMIFKLIIFNRASYLHTKFSKWDMFFSSYHVNRHIDKNKYTSIKMLLNGVLASGNLKTKKFGGHRSKFYQATYGNSLPYNSL